MHLNLHPEKSDLIDPFLMEKIIVHTDGGARGNPGPGAVGVVIKTEKGEILARLSQTIGETTNNVAEYQAVVAALEWLKGNTTLRLRSGQAMINFFLDSVLVVNQLNGMFRVKDSRLRDLLLKIRILEQEVGGQIVYTVIPREKNWEADLLVNEALDKQY